MPNVTSLETYRVRTLKLRKAFFLHGMSIKHKKYMWISNTYCNKHKKKEGPLTSRLVRNKTTGLKI